MFKLQADRLSFTARNVSKQHSCPPHPLLVVGMYGRNNGQTDEHDNRHVMVGGMNKLISCKDNHWCNHTKFVTSAVSFQMTVTISSVH